MGIISKILGVETLVSGESSNTSIEFRSRIETVLEEVRPALHLDGGEIELIAVVGNSAKVKLRGACDGCPSANSTLRDGIERRLKDEIPEFEELIPV